MILTYVKWRFSIFFTCVFTWRSSLDDKSTKSSPKIILLAKCWVRKSIFSPAVSQKPKTEVVYFLSALTLNWRYSWKSASERSFGAAYYGAFRVYLFASLDVFRRRPMSYFYRRTTPQRQELASLAIGRHLSYEFSTFQLFPATTRRCCI